MEDHNDDMMNGNSPGQGQAQFPLKSICSRERGFVSFKNHTDRVADVVWLNFEGKRKCYTENGLLPGKRLDLQTFATHPWIARDKETGDLLEFVERGGARRAVYMPEAWDGRRDYRAPIVRIQVPVYSLYNRSLQVVRKLLRNKDDVDELEIPKYIKYDLGHVADPIPK